MAKILIADDSSVQRTIFKKYLEKDGHSIVAEAKTGNDILKLYQETMPDLVLLDIVMPNANGIGILDQLINYDPDAIVIMCSGTSVQDVIMEVIQLGAKHYIIKPINRDTLLNIVRTTLEKQKN